jgi:hypothetical protein
MRVISNFLKIRGDIRQSKCTTGVNDTGGKIAAGINDTAGNFATGINDTGCKFCHQFRLCCCAFYTDEKDKTL